MFHVLDDFEDLLHDSFKRCFRAFLFRDDFLPVPLVHVAGMQVIENLIAADRVHVGIEAFMNFKAVFLQGISFPLCKRLHDFNPFSGHFLKIEGNRPFNAIEIIIQTALLRDKERGADPGKRQFFPEFFLERVADIFDCFLGFPDREDRVIVSRTDQIHIILLCFLDSIIWNGIRNG